MSKFVKTTLLAMGLWAAGVGANAQACGLRDNGDGTMTDPGTGLQIRKCAEGQSWAGSQCTGTSALYKFDQAVARQGRGEWRLMTVDEAKSIKAKVKGCNIASETWTSSRLDQPGFSPSIHYFYFTDGYLNSQDPRESAPVHLVRANQSSGNTSPSPPPQRPAPTPNTQQATAQQQPAQNRQNSRDRPDLMGHGCDVGQGNTVQNGCPQTIHYVMCIVRHPDGRTTGADTCLGGQFLSGSLSPQESRRVVDGNADYLVAACKNPARPYNFRYVPSSQGISTFCGQ